MKRFSLLPWNLVTGLWLDFLAWAESYWDLVCRQMGLAIKSEKNALT